jgi:ABC-2 type transport system permease protein
MQALIRIELYKIFSKWRTYIGFIAIAALIPLIEVAMLLEKDRTFDWISRSMGQSFIFVGNFLNTYFVSYLILNSIAIHIPFLITLVAGDLLAGEATAGTYRMLLTRPVSRFKVVTSKFAAGLIYANMLVLWLSVISMGLGYLLFGTGELIVSKSSQIIIFERADVFWRFILAYGYAALCMSVVASLAFFFSSLVENAIGPIITTMAIIIVFLIISTIDIDFFRNIQPFLFTNYMLKWQSLFDMPIDAGEVAKSVSVLAGHIVVLYSATLFIFKRKDILT